MLLLKQFSCASVCNKTLINFAYMYLFKSPLEQVDICAAHKHYVGGIMKEADQREPDYRNI
jgi:hypothetical protein